MTKNKSSNITSEICQRFCSFVDRKLDINYAELSRELGYANPTIFTSVKNQQSFINIEKLRLFFLLTIKKGEAIDLKWLLTGIPETDDLLVESLKKYPNLVNFLNNIDSKTLKNIDNYLSTMTTDKEK